MKAKKNIYSDNLTPLKETSKQLDLSENVIDKVIDNFYYHIVEDMKNKTMKGAYLRNLGKLIANKKRMRFIENLIQRNKTAPKSKKDYEDRRIKNIEFIKKQWY